MTRSQNKTVTHKKEYQKRKGYDYKKLLVKVGIGIVFLLILIMLQSYYVINKHNRLRKELENNTTMIQAKIIHRATGRHVSVNYATYEFSITDKIYRGRTFESYDGNIGDNICVKYLDTDPNTNIYCLETIPETFVNDVLLSSLKFIVILICIPFGLLLILIVVSLNEVLKLKNK
jgi:hypothetical protein